MKLFIALFLLVPSFSFAGLWCADSPIGTPSEVLRGGHSAYALAQIDYMGVGKIQVDVQDIYYNKSEIFTATLVEDSGTKVRGIALGNYISGERKFKLFVKNDRIYFTEGVVTFNCEIP